MADPMSDHSIISRAIEWVVVGMLGLIGVIYKMNDHKHDKAEERMDKLEDEKAEQYDLKKALTHIEKLFDNAETDRQRTRDMIDSRTDKLNATMQFHQTEVMKAIMDIKERCVK